MRPLEQLVKSCLDAFAVAAGVCALVICIPRIVCGETPHSSPDRTAYFRQLLDTAGTGWPCATAAGSCPFAGPCAPCTPCDQGSGTWPLQAPASGAPEAAASWWSGQPAQQFTGFTRPVPRPRERAAAAIIATPRQNAAHDHRHSPQGSSSNLRTAMTSAAASGKTLGHWRPALGNRMQPLGIGKTSASLRASVGVSWRNLLPRLRHRVQWEHRGRPRGAEGLTRARGQTPRSPGVPRAGPGACTG